jgi:Amt family ammonium transporter
MTLNGVLAGLVAITAGCDAVTPGGAILIGILAGTVVVFAVELFDKIIKIDDPVGAISVHGVCGALGTLLVGLFAQNGGLLYGGGTGLLVTQAIGVVSVAAWSLGLGLLLFLVIKYTIGLRVSKKEEENGLDYYEHGETAYN